MLDLEKIKKRAESASEGPWEITQQQDRPGDILVGSEFQVNWLCRMFHPLSSVPGTVSLAPPPGQCQANAEFIAHAREDVPALIAEVERLRGIINTALDISGDRPR